MKGWVAAVAIAAATASSAQDSNDEFAKNRTASFKSGTWTAEAADWKGYSFSPRLSCRIFSNGLVLTQDRPAESGEMRAVWSFFVNERRDANRSDIISIKIDGEVYQSVMLPWRLAAPAPPGDEQIVLSYGIGLQVVRRNRASQWLPASYLTLPMLEASALQIGYTVERDDKVENLRKTFSLKGFREAAKWCGRQLLPDLPNNDRYRKLLD